MTLLAPVCRRCNYADGEPARPTAAAKHMLALRHRGFATQSQPNYTIITTLIPPTHTSTQAGSGDLTSLVCMMQSQDESGSAVGGGRPGGEDSAG